MESDQCVQGVDMRTWHGFFLILIASIGFSQGTTIRNSIPVPAGYARVTFPEDSYSHWIQNLPLKPEPVIQDYRGRPVETGFYRIYGVVRMPILFQSNLEQCADFAMRFWAEYHKATGKLDRLYLFDYAGHKKFFAQSGKSFAQFLKQSFAYTNSHSLKNGCRDVPEDQMSAGDMFVQNERGGIGHVSVVMDVCRSRNGEKLFLVGYSFMPAQEFHIEKADARYGMQGWFTLEGYRQYLKDYLNYGKPALRRFDP